MRAAFGVLFLVLLFVAASLVQERWINGVRDRLPGLQFQSARETLAAEQRTQDESGWARLVIGQPSGADPTELAPRFPAPGPGRQMISGGTAEPRSFEEPEFAPEPSDYEITLDSDSTLSEVCVRFYGSGAPKLYNRLAEYNGFDNPNAIRAGHKLKIPTTRELLFSKHSAE